RVPHLLPAFRRNCRDRGRRLVGTQRDRRAARAAGSARKTDRCACCCAPEGSAFGGLALLATVRPGGDAQAAAVGPARDRGVAGTGYSIPRRAARHPRRTRAALRLERAV